MGGPATLVGDDSGNLLHGRFRVWVGSFGYEDFPGLDRFQPGDFFDHPDPALADFLTDGLAFY